MITRSAGTATLGAALVATLVFGGGAVAARADTIVCIDDGCDSGLWQAARGASNQISYWGMGAGHDCTNYVAWKLITNGVSAMLFSILWKYFEEMLTKPAEKDAKKKA